MALGRILRDEREQKGYTVAQVAEATHMMTQIVEELENEDFHRIAAPIYGRGFIKLYCDFLAIDPEPLIQEFNAIYSGQRRPAVATRTLKNTVAATPAPQPPPQRFAPVVVATPEPQGSAPAVPDSPPPQRFAPAVVAAPEPQGAAPAVPDSPPPARPPQFATASPEPQRPAPVVPTRPELQLEAEPLESAPHTAAALDELFGTAKPSRQRQPLISRNRRRAPSLTKRLAPLARRFAVGVAALAAVSWRAIRNGSSQLLKLISAVPWRKPVVYAPIAAVLLLLPLTIVTVKTIKNRPPPPPLDTIVITEVLPPPEAYVD